MPRNLKLTRYIWTGLIAANGLNAFLGRWLRSLDESYLRTLYPYSIYFLVFNLATMLLLFAAAHLQLLEEKSGGIVHDHVLSPPRLFKDWIVILTPTSVFASFVLFVVPPIRCSSGREGACSAGSMTDFWLFLLALHIVCFVTYVFFRMRRK